MSPLHSVVQRKAKTGTEKKRERGLLVQGTVQDREDNSCPRQEALGAGFVATSWQHQYDFQRHAKICSDGHVIHFQNKYLCKQKYLLTSLYSSSHLALLQQKGSHTSSRSAPSRTEQRPEEQQVQVSHATITPEFPNIATKERHLNHNMSNISLPPYPTPLISLLLWTEVFY